MKVMSFSVNRAKKFKGYLIRYSFFRYYHFCEKPKFVTDVDQKKTFRDIQTNFIAFITETYKTGLNKPLLFRCCSLYLDFIYFHHEVDILKSILSKN